MLEKTRPRFTFEDAKEVLRDKFGLDAQDIGSLPSERDQNFVVTTRRGKLVLKIANASERRESLEFQNEALAYVVKHDGELPVSKLVTTRAGENIAELDGGHLCRLLDYLPGKPLVDYRPHSAEILREAGRLMGRLDAALAGFTHDAQDRYLYWDSQHAARIIRAGLSEIEDEERRRLVRHFLHLFETTVAPKIERLPAGVIHNDGNDHNILVQDGRIAGILDFGDIVSSRLVFEIANTAAYCILGKPNPLEVASSVVGGYHETRPLNDDELELLFPLICTRLAMSVAISAKQGKDEPDKAYLRVSEKPAWEMLARLRDESMRLAHYRFRAACDLAPHPRAREINDWLEFRGEEATSVLPFDLKKTPVHELDLSVGSTELGGLEVIENVETFTEHVFGSIREAGARVGIGRYNEARPIYTSDAFEPEGEGFEPRTVHIGIDLFVDAGTTLRAPFAGRVHSFRINETPLDYGPTIILEHDTDAGDLFWTLYGHLSSSSLSSLEPGKIVEKGEVFATVGDYPVNGNWPPHLHFQIILDMLEKEGDFPGVAAPSERELWLGLCPDPSRVLGLPPSATVAPESQARAIQKRREDHLSGALSLSYRQPLHIVRGSGAFLYDGEARPYLDMVNNVCHVGHCHPRVARALERQIAVLNTNTRYLHENIVEYAERLTASLPDPLEVCFFVNSGSEANDLALRLARTHTGRKNTVVLDGAYHGNLTSLIEVSPYKFDGEGGRGAPEHVYKLAMPDGYRGRYRASDPGYGAKYLEDAYDTIERRPIGALIAESILSCGGQIVLPPGYLEGLYRFVRDAGGVCIADEVQVGFGRVGTHLWAFETQGVVPDIVTMGKPIGNGHPLAAVVTTREIAASFQNGMEYFNTFGGNPVSCAAGLAVLDVIEEENLRANARETGGRLRNGLRELQSRHPLIGDVRGRGLFLGFELVRDAEHLTPAADEASYLVNRMKEKGVLTSTDGPLENVIKLKPPLVFNAANADFFLDRLASVLTEDRLQP